MKNLSKILFILLLITFGCSKKESEDIAATSNSVKQIAIQQYSKTIEYGLLKKNNDFNDLKLDEANVTTLPNKKDVKILTVPYKTGKNKIKFVAVYTGSKGFGADNSKTLVFELINSDNRDALKSIETKGFNGSFLIKTPSGETIYEIRYVNNQPVKDETSEMTSLARTGRGSACSADGVGYCTGTKFESQGVFEMAGCFAGFGLCMPAFAADCYIENCW